MGIAVDRGVDVIDNLQTNARAVPEMFFAGGQMHTELNKVVTALGEFYAHETFLMEKDLGECTLTHRLAVHLEKQFSGWEVDCDYNRLGERILHLPHGTITSTDDDLAKSVFPDIVVHRRNIPNNLLAIEVRKAGNHQPPEHDRQKLRALTDQHQWFAYWIGVFLVLEKKSVISEVYVSGAIDEYWSSWMIERLRDAGLGV